MRKKPRIDKLPSRGSGSVKPTFRLREACVLAP